MLDVHTVRMRAAGGTKSPTLRPQLSPWVTGQTVKFGDRVGRCVCDKFGIKLRWKDGSTSCYVLASQLARVTPGPIGRSPLERHRRASLPKSVKRSASTIEMQTFDSMRRIDRHHASPAGSSISVIRPVAMREMWAENVRPVRGQDGFEQFCDLGFGVGLSFAKNWIVSWNTESFITSAIFFLLNFFLYYALWFGFVSFANRFLTAGVAFFRIALAALMLILIRVQDFLNFLAQLLPALHHCKHAPTAPGCSIGDDGGPVTTMGPNNYSWHTQELLLDSVAGYLLVAFLMFALLYLHAMWTHNHMRSEEHKVTYAQVKTHCLAHIGLYSIASLPVMGVYVSPTPHSVDHCRLGLILTGIFLVYFMEIVINMPSTFFRSFHWTNMRWFQKSIYLPMDVKHLVQRFRRFNTILSGLCFINISTSFNHSSIHFSLETGESTRSPAPSLHLWQLSIWLRRAVASSLCVLTFAIFNYLIYIDYKIPDGGHACRRRSSGVWWQFFQFLIYINMVWMGGVIAFTNSDPSVDLEPFKSGANSGRYTLSVSSSMMLIVHVLAHLMHMEKEEKRWSKYQRFTVTLIFAAIIMALAFVDTSIEVFMAANALIYAMVYFLVMCYGFREPSSLQAVSEAHKPSTSSSSPRERSSTDTSADNGFPSSRERANTDNTTRESRLSAGGTYGSLQDSGPRGESLMRMSTLEV